MGFNEKDKTESKETTTRPVQVRFERADSKEPPINAYVVFEVDGHAEHRQVPDELVAEHWTGSTKSLKNWVLAIIDLMEPPIT